MERVEGSSCCPTGRRGFAPLTRRQLLAGSSATAALALHSPVSATTVGAEVDLAAAAGASSALIPGHAAVDTVLLPRIPSSSRDRTGGAWTSWPTHGAQSIELAWPDEITAGAVEVYWFDDGGGVPAPAAATVSAWDGAAFVDVAGGIGVARDRFNRLEFAPLRTRRMRLDIVARPGRSVGVLRWRVLAAGPLPAIPPAVDAGIDRTVMLNGQTYLSARAGWAQRLPGDRLRWSKASGPGDVIFKDAAAAETVARFSRPGDYLLRLTANAGQRSATSSLHVRVATPPPAKRLEVVYTTPYSISSPFWRQRAKALIETWIPQCVAYCERTDLPTGDGGIDNFVEAAKALRGEPHAAHKGYVFSNAWVHQTVESICLALMVDPEGDERMADAQAGMRATLERWIPIILAAQHPDGYLQTAFTLAKRSQWPERWTPSQRDAHEGYVGGYFIEAAINHHTLTGGRDLRLYKAARRLADCWVTNIGPGRKTWFDGHQEMEQALVRFGRFVNDVEGDGSGDPYVRLARFLIDSRAGGTRYDQSHLPAVRQYEAVGHAVRAVYFYSGMADIAAETGDTDYQSAVASLWDNMVNRKYYVTGGVGSGDTAEGFGNDYGLRHDGYCESCSSCGLIFFQYKMNIAYHQARYADLYEETLYNALLGGLALDGGSFCYTNPLVGTERARWHSCPCCVGNIARTLLMLPTWTYAKRPDALFVNLFVGGSVDVGTVAGSSVRMTQETNYPWEGAVALRVDPAAPTRFALHVRVPDRQTSSIYASTPEVRGIVGLTVNGRSVRPRIVDGYAIIDREWHAGDTVRFELPLAVQKVRAIDRVEATRGETALRYGPLVYSMEAVDQPDISSPIGDGAIAPRWRPDLLGGVVALEGRWRDGSPMTAIPYYARQNRLASPPGEFPLSDGALGGETVANVAPGERRAADRISRVWASS